MKIPFGYQLLHIYGPLAIHSYGLIIAIGVAISMWLTTKNKRYAQLNLEHSFVNIILVGFAAAFIGGRALTIISETNHFSHWSEWFAFWEGGFSILGSILGVIAIIPWYLKKIKIPIIPFFDLVAIYAPLLQSISRLGCFAAGCCYGIETSCALGVMYTNPNTIAPQGVTLHPTQLYSSVLLFSIFLFMYFIGQKKITKSGNLFATYLLLVSTERFVVDFWRAERIMSTNLLSFNQLVALGILSTVASFLLARTFSSKKVKIL